MIRDFFATAETPPVPFPQADAPPIVWPGAPPTPGPAQGNRRQAFRLPRGVLSSTDERWLESAGWTLKSGMWHGWFFAGKHQVQGAIDFETGVPKVTFRKPPRAVVAHGCVHAMSGGWYDLHEHS